MTTKVYLIKAMVFPVVMYGCESLTIKKAEWRRIDAFELWCWKRFLRVPWTARKSNQSIVKEINPEYSLEGLMKLKLQYFGHLMWRTDSLEKTLMLERLKTEGEGDDRGWDVGRHHQLNGHEFEQTLGDGEVHFVTKSQTRLSDWTTTRQTISVFSSVLGFFFIKILSITKMKKDMEVTWKSGHGANTAMHTPHHWQPFPDLAHWSETKETRVAGYVSFLALFASSWALSWDTTQGDLLEWWERQRSCYGTVWTLLCLPPKKIIHSCLLLFSTNLSLTPWCFVTVCDNPYTE